MENAYYLPIHLPKSVPSLDPLWDLLKSMKIALEPEDQWDYESRT